MKITALLNPENGKCRTALSLLKEALENGAEILKVILVLENTYHAQKWVLSFALPVSKEEIEKIKEKYLKKVLAEWEALTGSTDLPTEVVVDDAQNLAGRRELKEADRVLLGCLNEKGLCKLIETLDKPISVAKN